MFVVSHGGVSRSGVTRDGTPLRFVPDDERVGAEARALSCRSGFARWRAKDAQGAWCGRKNCRGGGGGCDDDWGCFWWEQGRRCA